MYWLSLSAVVEDAPPVKSTMVDSSMGLVRSIKSGSSSIGSSAGEGDFLPFTEVLLFWLDFSASLAACKISLILVIFGSWGICDGKLGIIVLRCPHEIWSTL